MKYFIYIFLILAVSLQAQIFPILEFGSEGENRAQFQFPKGITVDNQGNIFVIDSGNHRLQKFDKNGQFIKLVGGFGWERDQFQNPLDVFTQIGLNVFVTDFENERVERFDKDLNWITSIKTEPDIDEKLSWVFPTAVASSLHGDIFLIDDEYKRIVKLDAQYKAVASFGGYDWGEGALEEPSDIFVSTDDKIYVTDKSLHRIHVYDYFGNFEFAFGNDYSESPSSLAVSNGLVFVTDSGSNSVTIFDSSGHFITTFGSKGEKLGAFNNPGGIAVFQNRIYISDTDNHRIQILQFSRLESDNQ